jgi:N-acetylmuramoyl-L-alanine amidase
MGYYVTKDQLTFDGTNVPNVASPNVGGKFDPILLVIHYTASGPNSDIASYFANPATKVSAHLVIRRDGTIIQCVPFNTVAWHAGKSTWTFADGQVRTGLNQHAIGIEIENWGPLQRSPSGWVSWTGAAVDPTRVIEARHKFGTPDCGWETFTEAQVTAALGAAQAICTKYNIHEIVGHDDIAPGRKSDPGPAFNMGSFVARITGRADDSDGTYAVKSESGLNLRVGPGTNYQLVREQPLPNGTKVLVHEAMGSWRMVTTLNAAGVPSETGWVNVNWLSAI